MLDDPLRVCDSKDSNVIVLVRCVQLSLAHSCKKFYYRFLNIHKFLETLNKGPP